jgi:hypothetical protein
MAGNCDFLRQLYNDQRWTESRFISAKCVTRVTQVTQVTLDKKASRNLRKRCHRIYSYFPGVFKGLTCRVKAVRLNSDKFSSLSNNSYYEITKVLL